ncbi:hypothetical protein ACGFI5_04075 [Micromonospora tulbaghiae]|uniref:hypothetical protein n=1 Tax=Micromonospora tulbaghiae TaxID=479978 RepID=UPI00371064F7
MTSPWNIAIPAVAALVATLSGVVIGALLTRHAQFVQWSRASRLEAYVAFLKAYSVVYDGLGHACRHQTNPTIDWTQWNQALATLSLVSTRSVMENAIAVDNAIWSIDACIVNGDSGMGRWLEFRKELEAKRVSFVNAARRELAVEQAPLVQVVGSNRRAGMIIHNNNDNPPQASYPISDRAPRATPSKSVGDGE